VAVAASAIALLLYACGLRIVLLPVFIAISVWRLPMPRIFSSWFGRVVIALLLTIALLQVGASLQFILFPKSDFITLAAITWLLYVAVWLWAPVQVAQRCSIISSSDICAFLVIACFIAPFSPVFVGHNSIEHIAQIGSLQAIDATNHYAAIAELTQAQHLNYAPGYYYPKGFHIAAGFMQNTVFRSQYGLGWQGNVWLFFADYMVYGALLGYLVYFLCLSWLRALNEKLVPDGWSWPKVLLAACLAPPLVLLYLLPFVPEGFLSYYYVCITLIGGLLYLGELRYTMKTRDSSLDLARDAPGRWMLVAYLLLLFGAGVTWPLLIPPFVLIGILFLIPGRLRWRLLCERLWTVSALPVLLVFVLQLLPLYFQLKYSSTATQQSLNLTGGLTQFHPYVLLVGLLIVAGVVASTKVEEAYRRIVAAIFLPLFGFEVLLLVFQYFTTGEVRYYAIKVSLLIEMLLLALSVAVLVRAFVSSKLYEARLAWLLPVLPLFVMILLVSSVDNPLKDTRDLFRNRSNDVIPQYLGEDVSTDVKLGEAGKLAHFNLTELHYNSAQGKFFADMQVPYWADMMQYSASKSDFQAAGCIGQIYSNLAFGTYDAAAQQLLTKQLKTCVAAVHRRGETFYIVTDPASVSAVRGLLGNTVTIVVD
jgi:hypothetical protein